MNKKTLALTLSFVCVPAFVSAANTRVAVSDGTNITAVDSATATINEQAVDVGGDIYRGTIFGAEQKPYHSDVLGERPRSQSKIVYDTSLIRAIKISDSNRVRTLLQAHVDANEKNYAGITPLTVAGEKGNVDIIRMLVEDGKADINAKSSYGITPVIAAASAGQAEAISFLVKHGADVMAKDDLGKTATIYAASYDAPKALEDLVSMERATVNMPDNNGNTPIIYAAQKGFVNNVKVLLAAQADANYTNPSGLSALAAASAEGHIAVVKLLSKNEQVDLNVADKHNRTPIFYAVEKNQADILKVLLLAGADPNRQNNKGVSALMNASSKNLQDCQKLLLRRKNIDLEAKDAQGRTALFYSAFSGDIIPAKQLVEAGADINVTDNKGTTPLMNAIFAKNDRTAVFFIQQGANLAAVNSSGATALTLAKKFLPESSTLALLEMSRDAIAQDTLQFEAAKLAEVRQLEDQLAQEEATVAELEKEKEAERQQELAKEQAAARAKAEQEYQAKVAMIAQDPEVLRLQQQLEAVKAKKMEALEAQGKQPASVQNTQKTATPVQRKTVHKVVKRRQGTARRNAATATKNTATAQSLTAVAEKTVTAVSTTANTATVPAGTQLLQ